MAHEQADMAALHSRPAGRTAVGGTLRQYGIGHHGGECRDDNEPRTSTTLLRRSAGRVKRQRHSNAPVARPTRKLRAIDLCFGAACLHIPAVVGGAGRAGGRRVAY